jgi:hypothetical protein
MFDRTTKTLLTLIAIALWVQLLSPMFIPVATKAQSTRENQLIAAKGGQAESSSLSFGLIPVAVDADAGMVYVVTADGMPYQYAASDLRKQAEQRIREK